MAFHCSQGPLRSGQFARPVPGLPLPDLCAAPRPSGPTVRCCSGGTHGSCVTKKKSKLVFRFAWGAKRGKQVSKKEGPLWGEVF